MTTLEMIGFVGTILVVSAYIPQIVRLLKTKNSAGISISAWIVWLVGTFMISAHAIKTGDMVFILLQGLTLILVAAVLILALRYKNRPSF